MTPEQRQRLTGLRVRQQKGEALTDAELTEAYLLLRDGRQDAFHASEGARRKKAKVLVPDLTAIMGDAPGGVPPKPKRLTKKQKAEAEFMVKQTELFD